MVRRFATILAACVPAVLAPAAARADSSGAVFLPLGDLAGGDFYSVATRISSDGSTVVGYSHSSSETNADEAFRWTEAEGMVGLGGPSSPPATRAVGVSADGSFIVLSGPGPWPILWRRVGGMVEIADTTGTMQIASPKELSADASTIVGSGREVGSFDNEAFRWTPGGGFEPLGWLPSIIHDSFLTAASADGSVLAGFSFHQGTDVEPMIWTGASGLVSLGDVPGGDPYALAWGISDDGTTVVGEAHIGGSIEPWLWRDATGFVRPDTSHGASGGGWFQAVSADGSVAVGAPALVWDAVHGLRSLVDVLGDAGIDLSGWLLQTAFDVSADGRTIVGYGTNPGGDTEAWLARLPETPTAVPDGPPRAALALVPLDANPARGACAFRLTLPRAVRVRARIFSVDGRLVRSLVDAPMTEGAHVLRWNGKDDGGRQAVSGAYLLHVVAGDAATTRKIVRVD